MMVVHHNVWLEDDTPLIKLLYHTKLLEQDLKKAQERAMAQNAQRTGSGRGVIRNRRG